MAEIGLESEIWLPLAAGFFVVFLGGIFNLISLQTKAWGFGVFNLDLRVVENVVIVVYVFDYLDWLLSVALLLRL